MSRKESRVGGDPVEGTESPAREPDNQEGEEMPESLNSEMQRGFDIQSTCDHQASVSGQKQGDIFTNWWPEGDGYETEKGQVPKTSRCQNLGVWRD